MIANIKRYAMRRINLKPMAQKLYTEEQVRKAMADSYIIGTERENNRLQIEEYILKNLTPIELPSDEEIEDKSIEKCFIESPYIQDVCEHYFETGAKWMKEQILNQNK